ncbi:TetR family transcriptional regulator [Scopulibacillus darangshiensis]|uniref:TetR family transcriptional regulator n=1 Tax=Scopulibacillus darangshiensis TaxID=442528 RepID=A0A4R2P2K4_9BACL|nr:TetR/AcrR family transcriptional regulator [Scopulibacillus darangshiensis]TCP28953.1 TetR family transcriptional regulator [Scopulibacillus darangshiensis]
MTKEPDRLPARKLKSLQTRMKLLAAGSDIFIKEGFQKATISQIIKKAETGYGTAYVHFKNKDDILIVLMDDVMNRFYDIAEFSFEPNTKVEAYGIIEKQVSAFLEMANEERKILKVVEEAIGVSEEVRKKWQTIRERFIERISRDVAFAQKNGLARRDVDCTLVARGWFYANEMYLWDIVRNDRDLLVNDVVHNLTAMYTGGLYIQ